MDPAQGSPIVEKARGAWSRRGSETGLDLFGRALQVLGELATARFRLRACDRVGRRARTRAAPRVVNAGRIEIGDDVILLSRWSPVELVTAPGGRIEIGDGVHVNYGTLISARERVRIGDRAQIGQYCIVADTEGPAGDEVGPGEPRPVEIGADAWLAGRVTVLPGVRIGAGSVVTAGSIVAEDVPPGVVVGGNPARVLRRVGEDPEPLPVPSAPPAAAPATPAMPLARGVLVSDFTIDPLARFLASPVDGASLEADVAPFAQVTQTILQGPAPGADGFVVVWTRPETAVPAFERARTGQGYVEADLLAEVDAHCALLERAAAAWKLVLVPTWTTPPGRRGMGALDARQGGTRALALCNARLLERLASLPNVVALDAARWATVGGKGAQGARAWFMGKVAFGDEVLVEAARDVQAAVLGSRGGARKLVVVDLDDTLWGGIVGDVGWQGLKLGGHDAAGEAFVAFQRRLKELTRRGIVLAIVSKNEEATALEAIRSHPEMVLREEDFVAWRINWTDKARNVADLVASLNLGLQSTVFIDDNPVERARVREALPEVLVPEWPEDKLLYPAALDDLRCFDVTTLSAEDAERTRLYAAERQRETARAEVGSLDAWLATLEIRVRAEPVGPANVARAAQLLNKTNQMNLTTRRLTEAELLDWSGTPGQRAWAISVSDRFGDAGLTGVVSVAVEGGKGRVVDYLLSCRVMGRRVEETMVHLAVEGAMQLGAREVEAVLVPTRKNKPCLDFWARSGLDRTGPESFRWDAARGYPLPDCIRLEWRREDA